MPISGHGWEFHIIRHTEQERVFTDKLTRRRTVGSYQIYIDGVKQTGKGLSGSVAEARGPGSNKQVGNGRCIETGRYPLLTQDGEKYVTIGYELSESTMAIPKPGILLGDTNKRIGILIHPGRNFLSSVGCINPCTSLPNGAENIDFIPSRARVITIIQSLKDFAAHTFPKKNGLKIQDAFVVVDEDPAFK